MQAIVLSAGRSGTNLVLECLTGNPSFLYDIDNPEDKELLRRNEALPDKFITKYDTIYIPSTTTLDRFMELNSKAMIIYTIRHPYDWVLSKMYRGRIKEGHNTLASDATVEGCKADLSWGWDMLFYLETNHPDRILRVKMEDVILSIQSECFRMCDFLGVPFEKTMCFPHLRMRAEEKRKRYGNKLDISQINVYLGLPDIYDGYFKNLKEEIAELFTFVSPLIKEFNYE